MRRRLVQVGEVLRRELRYSAGMLDGDGCVFRAGHVAVYAQQGGAAVDAADEAALRVPDNLVPLGGEAAQPDFYRQRVVGKDEAGVRRTGLLRELRQLIEVADAAAVDSSPAGKPFFAAAFGDARLGGVLNAVPFRCALLCAVPVEKHKVVRQLVDDCLGAVAHVHIPVRVADDAEELLLRL